MVESSGMKQEPTSQIREDPLLQGFIVPYEGALPAEVCQAIIATFEEDPRRTLSKTAAGAVEKVRSGTLIDMAGHPEWAELKKLVTAKTVECLHDYAKRFPAIEFILNHEEITLTPPLVERLDPGQGFAWHIDSGPMGTARRFLSALTYLNTVEDAGATEFPWQRTRLKPKRGTIVLFPPYWLFPHRGTPPKREKKYKMTCYFMVPERPEFQL